MSFELKWDGVRAVTYLRHGVVRVISRRRRELLSDLALCDQTVRVPPHFVHVDGRQVLAAAEADRLIERVLAWQDSNMRHTV
jgi:ATP-dependent DNA ligase